MSMLDMLRARLDGMIARAVIARVNDAMKTQRLQIKILADETCDSVEHFQPYGLSFVPPDGAEVVALALAGARSNTIAICAQHPDQRPKDGDPATGGLYTKGEWRIFIDADGIVHAGAESGEDWLALATKCDDEIKRIWDTLGHASIVAAPVAGPDAGEPGLTALKAQVSAAKAQVQSVAATKVKAT